MREFFRSWKRKVGVVTLVMACVFMAGWVRSNSLQDVVTFQSGEQAAEYLMSIDGNLVLERVKTRGPSKTDTKWFINKLPIWFGSLKSPDVHWHWRCQGFGIGEVTTDRLTGTRSTLWSIPYWSLVAPLTMLSAYLLLTKPRRRFK